MSLLKRKTLQDWAVGTLAEWFQGYTDASVDTDFMQYKLVIIDDNVKNGFLFEVREGPYFSGDIPPELYVATVKVRKYKSKKVKKK